jgi:hypothetical protein
MLVRPRISKLFGMMPVTRHNSPSSRISCPTRPGSRLKRVSHRPSLSTTTLARCCSSSAVNVRPAIGSTPSTSKMPAETHCRDTVNALPSLPAITMLPIEGM